MDTVIRGRHTSSIRRLTESGLRWRVLVETWPESDKFRGRLLFHRDSSDGAEATRESATLLHGESREEVLALAHDLPEDHLRRVLHSLC